MLANTMHSAAAQALRACGRTSPAVKSLTTTSAVSRVLLARHTFLVTPAYKARLAPRGYATATATKTKPRTTPTAAAKKKPAAKKAPVKAKAKPKAAKKPVKKAKAKPAKKKPVAKKAKRVKKEPSEETKLATLKRTLKQTALINKEPAKLPYTPWLVFSVEQHTKLSDFDGSFVDKVRTIAADFKNISASERSRLEQKAAENKVTNDLNYKKWVESHPVEDIVKANNARHRLHRDFSGSRGKRGYKILDDRVPTRPVTAFANFIKSQLVGSSNCASDMKEAGSRWKTLSDAEKKPFQDLAAAESSRYAKQREASGLYI